MLMNPLNGSFQQLCVGEIIEDQYVITASHPLNSIPIDRLAVAQFTNAFPTIWEVTLVDEITLNTNDKDSEWGCPNRC